MITLQEIVKRVPTFSNECLGKKVEAWRVKGGYVTKWTGFGIGNVAPRNEMPEYPFFEGTTMKAIQCKFEELCYNEL